MLTFDDIVDRISVLSPSKIAVRDGVTELDYKNLKNNGYNLANYFSSIGIKKKDRVVLLAYNCIEFSEIMYATSKVGAIISPINFRLSSDEIKDILLDCKPKIILYQKSFQNIISVVKMERNLKHINTLIIDRKDKESFNYKNAITYSDVNTRKSLKNNIFNQWSLMYTSGTTGKPKGVVRDHKGYYNLSSVTGDEIGINEDDNALLVMPLCHANSFNFFCAYIKAGATITLYTKKSFEVNYFFKLINNFECTFTSLVPTHFIIILEYLKKCKINNAIKRPFTFMISSAPARKDTKREILKYFKKAKLFELYGSSESGWVTMLHPKDQFNNIGSVGKECIGTSNIKILDKNFEEVKDGEIGELFAKTPYNFSHYWNNKEKTKEAFFRDYVTVGDLARRNFKGFIELIDRKKNMIISGGENIYPAEVENILGSHSEIKDVAIVGYPDKKWGEIVCCFAILEDGAKITEIDLIEWTKNKIANYKCPKKVFFIEDKDMPRNTTGKILHKILREKIKLLLK